MAKSKNIGGSKKKVSIGLIIAVIIGIIILLLILLLLWNFLKIFIIKNSFPVDYISSYNYTNYTNNSLENLEGDLPYTDPYVENPTPVVNDSKREYKTSNKLTELTFARDVEYQEDYITWKLHINIKVTGYLQEIDPTTSNLNRVIDRVYVFKDSNVNYDLFGSEIKDDGELCRHEYSDEGKGSKSIGELNVDTGDKKRSMIPVAGWGSWALAYSDYGFYTDTPEISLEGFVLFPIKETVLTTKLKDSAICNGDPNFKPVQTFNHALSPMFPFRLNKVDINQKSYSGSFEAENDASQEHDPVGRATFDSAQLGLDKLIDLPYDAPGNWKIVYNINLP
jgi:hypothetical protein